MVTLKLRISAVLGVRCWVLGVGPEHPTPNTQLRITSSARAVPASSARASLLPRLLDAPLLRLPRARGLPWVRRRRGALQPSLSACSRRGGSYSVARSLRKAGESRNADSARSCRFRGLPETRRYSNR